MLNPQTSFYVGTTCGYCSFIPVSNGYIHPFTDKKTNLHVLLVQELCKKFPDNKKVMFGIVASDYPRLNVTKEYAVMHAEANLSMYVNNDGGEELAFTLVAVS